MIKIAIFASGSGTNAENLARYFEHHPDIRIALMISDRKNAFVFERMKPFNIPSIFQDREDFENGNVLKLLHARKIDFIILAGFLKLLPAPIIRDFQNKIINIHPALLPRYGGKGMYGRHVHEAVVNAGDQETGITIHFVNENFDEGEIISQYRTEIAPGDTAEIVAAKIHQLEMEWFPRVAEKVIMQTAGL